MNERFAAELDRYERELAPRVGTFAASEARRELAAHVEADLAARLELGVPESEAYAQALASLGDLMSIARAERRGPQLVAEIVLLLAPLFLAIEWYLPQAIPIQTHWVFVGAAAIAICTLAATSPRLHRSWMGAFAGGTLAMVAVLVLAMVTRWRDLGEFRLPELHQGSWWQAVVFIPMFGLPPLVLFRTVAAISRRVPGKLKLQWVQRG